MNGSFHPARRVNRRGEKSRAGLMADPAFRPKLCQKKIHNIEWSKAQPITYLRWMAVSPSPMVRGTRLLWIFMFLSSVTARMMMSSMAVPSIWSMARLTVVTWWYMLLVQIHFDPTYLCHVKERIS